MISSAIWCKISTCKFFKDYKLHEPYGLVQFCCLRKIYSCLLTPNYTWNHVVTCTKYTCITLEVFCLLRSLNVSEERPSLYHMTFKLITTSDRTEFLFDCVASLFSMKFHSRLESFNWIGLWPLCVQGVTRSEKWHLTFYKARSETSLVYWPNISYYQSLGNMITPILLKRFFCSILSSSQYCT